MTCASKKPAILPRVMLAAVSSGSGKTLLTCALLECLREKGHRPAAFKCGPDYIDPMFHRQIEGVTSRNLDLFLAGGEGVRRSLQRGAAAMDRICDQRIAGSALNASRERLASDSALELTRQRSIDAGIVREDANHRQADICVIEGVMGLYDGSGPDGAQGSSYEIAAATETPIILIIDAHGMSRSAVAVAKGFQALDTHGLIRGILLNRVSPSIYSRMKAWIEEETGLTVVGGIPLDKELHLESRHLGLQQPWEVPGLQYVIAKAAPVFCQNTDVGSILAIAGEAPQLLIEEKPGTQAASEQAAEKETVRKTTVAVARDEAFTFFYDDNLDLLRELGADVKFFSPIHDSALPEADGLILGGGYPELYARELSRNDDMVAGIRRAAKARMPILAECGGFVYLQESLTLRDGERFAMAGVLPGHVTMTDRLGRFGYVTLTGGPHGSGDETVMDRQSYLHPGESIRGHEFHYSDCTENGSAYLAVKQDGRSWPAIVCQDRIWAGYPHLYYPSNPLFAARFLKACREYHRCEAGSSGWG